MDIALKLKRAVAVVATGAFFVSTAATAIAQTFNDVPTDAWYYDYVEQLVSDGVIDAADNYRPADALNRAELTKIAITAIDGLAGYEAPATPTFDDVPADAWFYDYVEAAVQLGIVNGYADANGNLTGMFGPGDTVNRAAATKILVNAFSVPTDLDPASIFPDVKTTDWYHDYVITAYNQSILDGYNNGYFGPADPITRAQVAKLVVNSQNPVERVSGEGEGEGEGEPTSEGNLEVSLNDNTAASSTLPLGANGVALASYDFTADQDAVYVSNLVVTRGGVGQAGDWDNLYLYEGATRLTTGRTINSDTNTATFALKVTVDAGTTTTLTLVGDVANPAGASNQHYFYVASAANVTSNAKSVSGDFPIAGNTFTMGGATTVVNSVTVAPGTAPAKVTIGEQDAEIASIKLTAGAQNDIAVHQMALTNGGSLASSKLVNLKLLRGTDEVATSEGFVDDIVTFVLDTPYLIPEGQTKTFYVHADVDGGRSTDNIILYLDEDTDMIAVDQQYGFGAQVTNNFGQALANTVTLQGGDVTVVDNGPAASQIARNTTNVELLNFSVTTARDLTVRDTALQIDIQNVAGTGPTLPVTGTGTVQEAGDFANSICVTDAAGATYAVGDMIQFTAASGTLYGLVTAIVNSGACLAANTEIQTNLSNTDAVANGVTVTEVDPYDYVKNVKIVDLDSGSTMAGPSTDANAGATIVAGPPSSYNKVYTEDYEFIGGETRHLSIQVDVDKNMASGYQVAARVRFSDGVSTSSYVKDLAANEFVATASIIGAGQTWMKGDFMITAENSLAVSRASTPTSQEYVKGDSAVPGLGIALKAGDAGDIVVKRLNVRLYGNSTTNNWVDAEGDTAANTLVSSVTLYDGNDVVSGPKSISLVDPGSNGYTAGTDYYRAQFDDLNMVINAGGTKTLTAKINLLNSSSTTMYLALDVDPTADVLAEDNDANNVTPTGLILNDTVTKNPLLTILTSGDLTASSEGNPDPDILVAGATEQLVAKYRFHALKEDFNVKKLTITNDATGDFGDADTLTSAVAKVVIKYPDVNGVTQTTEASLSGTGQAKFAGLTFYVPAGEDAYLEVYSNVNTKAMVGESISGKTLRLGLKNTGNDITTFEAIGQSSSTNLNFTGAPTVKVLNSASVNVFGVRTSVPTFANVSASTSLVSGTDKTLMSFSVTADSAGAVSFGRFFFDLSKYDAVGGNLNLQNFKVYRGSTLINAVNIYSNAVGDVSFLTNPGAPLTAGTTSDTIIVSFTQEETVGSGSTQTYHLKAEVLVAEQNDTISTQIAVGDENTPVTGIIGDGISGCTNDPVVASTGNGNTGRVLDTAAANCALFTATTGDFVTLVSVGRNIIWSDKSADGHAYPSIPGGVLIVDGTGSYDWTNGYLLKITNLTSHTLQKS